MRRPIIAIGALATLYGAGNVANPGLSFDKLSANAKQAHELRQKINDIESNPDGIAHGVFGEDTIKYLTGDGPATSSSSGLDIPLSNIETVAVKELNGLKGDYTGLTNDPNIPMELRAVDSAESRVKEGLVTLAAGTGLIALGLGLTKRNYHVNQ
jgi:hypothetical protein